ncbi:MAG: trypsin-like peptidase domain-containing protein [Desulfobulbaceae bacterium]|nr:trypsin-like peptidase domain-containing protein [Desulfobulbaceae bacterium]HIJ90561.1 PDZ domain-containing protein [Deltaproteobacteria bacterium]
MSSEKKAENTAKTILQPERKCDREYKPWIWTLVAMSLVTIVWALYEGSQEQGYVNNFLSNQPEVNKALPGTGTQVMPAPGAVGDVQISYHGIIDAIRPAVVSIDAAMKIVPNAANQGMVDQFPNDVAFNKIGSGVIIDPNGYVLSSYHVIAGAEALKATVYGPGGATEYPLKMVKGDLRTDMALLRIQGTGPFPHATLGDSDAARTGDMVLTVGNPFGFEQTVTSGMISSRNRTLQVGDAIFENLIQTDSAINRGSSGGPMLNVRGEVIGINTAIFAPTGVFNGIGFAIPINRAAELVGGVVDFNNTAPAGITGQLVAMTSQGRQVGNAYRMPNGQMVTPPHTPRGSCVDCHPQLFLQQHTAQPGVAANADPFFMMPQQQQGVMPLGAGAGPGRGLFGRTNGGPITGNGQFIFNGQQMTFTEPLMGVGLVDVDDIICRQAQMLHPEGVMVVNVIPNSPADIAGIQRGDIMVRLAGRKILNIVKLNDLLSTQNIGHKFDIVYLRNGSRMTTKVKTGFKSQAQQFQQLGPMQQAIYQWQLGATITPLPPAFANVTNAGVYVQNSGGLLAANGLRSGDIIRGINGVQVDTLDAFVKQTKKVDSTKGFVLDVIRSGNSMYLTIRG